MIKFSLAILFALTYNLHKPEISVTIRSQSLKVDSIPTAMLGFFTDDYGIEYEISDTLWMQHPSTRFHIIKWDLKRQYIVARNDAGNPSDPGLFTRIDFMEFKDMPPYFWGYCLTAYNAPDEAAAGKIASADRNNPRKGCNGFPFSRMKKIK